MEKKKTVVVYESFYEAMKHLSTDAAKVALFNGMMEYGLNGIEPEFDTTELKLSWTFYKPNMDANMKRYAKAVDSGRKGGKAKAANSKVIQIEDIPKETIQSSLKEESPKKSTYKEIMDEFNNTKILI